MPSRSIGERHRSVDLTGVIGAPGELLHRGRFSVEVARRPGERLGGGEVLGRVVVARQREPSPTSQQLDAAGPGGITKHRAPVERPRQQHVRLVVGEGGGSPLRRREPLIDGQLPVTTRGGVLGRGPGLVGEQPTEPAVAERASRRGSRLVHHLADHVVGELVSDIGLAHEMGA